MGILLSFVVAFIDAFNNTFIKRGTASFSLLTVTWAWQVFSLLILLPALLITGIPTIQAAFWYSALLKVVMQIVALFLYAAALRQTDLSLAVPMLAFTPAVTMIVSFFLTKDTLSVAGVIGVVLIISGVYSLNMSDKNKNLLAPFKAILENKGVLLMFLVSLLWGVTTSLDRIAVLNSAPIFYSAFVAVAISVILTPITIFSQKKEFIKVFKLVNLKRLLPIGLLEGAGGIVQMTAIGLTLAAYMIAIKRSSIIISSILGYVMFKENIQNRLLPILIMFLGIILIVIFK